MGEPEASWANQRRREGARRDLYKAEVRCPNQRHHEHTRGIMSEAVGLLCDHAFRACGLHRLEAACIPDNTRSIRILEKAGFAREGYLRSYLKINGAWRDHVLYARINPQHERAGLQAKQGEAV